MEERDLEMSGQQVTISPGPGVDCTTWQKNMLPAEKTPRESWVVLFGAGWICFDMSLTSDDRGVVGGDGWMHDAKEMIRVAKVSGWRDGEKMSAASTTACLPDSCCK